MARSAGVVVLLLACAVRCVHAAAFHLYFNMSLSQNITGRAFVILSTNFTIEPRLQISDESDTQQIFGTDVDSLAPGQIAIIGESTLGYPLDSLAVVPAGDYWVQGVLQPYQQYRPQSSQGKPLWLLSTEVNKYGGVLGGPGTIYSKPFKSHVEPGPTDPIEIRMDQVVPARPPPSLKDTEYLKHVRVRSALLSAFWGTDVFLEACVLLPWGWDNHTTVKYPLVVYHGHYSDDWATPVGFSETPPPPELTGYAQVQAQYAYYLYRNWTAPDGLFKSRRVIIMTVKHPNPFYDDSYAVNSANLGPYGDAIVNELIPFVEQSFRGLGAGWARTLYGGSTGGWEALAAQIFYRHNFSGAWGMCPDPVDFRRYTTVNVYENRNAYYVDAPWKRTPRPAQRDEPSNGIYPGYGTPDGITVATVQEMNRRELVLGNRSRSGGQYDIWEAVFSPVGPDGFPRRIWDKHTGQIDPVTASYWRDHYDLSYLVQKNWAAWSADLQGKLRVYVGMSDTYFLNDAVYLFEQALSALNPPAKATVQYGQHDGRGFEHCWSGDAANPNSIARLTINQRFVPEMVDQIVATAPKDAPMDWRY